MEIFKNICVLCSLSWKRDQQAGPGFFEEFLLAHADTLRLRVNRCDTDSLSRLFALGPPFQKSAPLLSSYYHILPTLLSAPESS